MAVVVDAVVAAGVVPVVAVVVDTFVVVVVVVVVVGAVDVVSGVTSRVFGFRVPGFFGFGPKAGFRVSPLRFSGFAPNLDFGFDPLDFRVSGEFPG